MKNTKILIAISLICMALLGILISMFVSTQGKTDSDKDVDVSEVIKRPGFTIRKTDGVIQREGKSHFLFGFYHVSDYQNRYGKTMADDIALMDKAGFNVVQLTVTGPDGLKSTQEARAKARELGVDIIASYYAPKITDWISQLQNDTSIIAWNNADDFNVPYNKPKTGPGDVLASTKTIKEYAKSLGWKTLTYGSGGGYPFAKGKVPYLFASYYGTLDLYGVQAYPISNNDGAFKDAPLEESIAYYKYVKGQMPSNSAVIANIQTFKWNGGRFPTASETRNMTYGSLIADVSGILAYAYHENSGTLPTVAKGVWDEMVALRKDIDGDFLAAIMDGKQIVSVSDRTAGKAKIHTSSWVYKNPTTKKTKVYVVLVNTSSKEELPRPNASGKLVKLPAEARGKNMKPLVKSARYVTTLTSKEYADGTYMEGRLPKEGVAVYVFE